MTSDQIKTALDSHAKWRTGDGGERACLRDAYLTGAYLRGACLRGAYLRGADLRGADLRGADLDFAVWPLHCGSVGAKSGDRLLSQLLYHITRLDGEHLSKEGKRRLNQMRRHASADWFLRYRNDLTAIAEFGKA